MWHKGKYAPQSVTGIKFRMSVYLQINTMNFSEIKHQIFISKVMIKKKGSNWGNWQYLQHTIEDIYSPRFVLFHTFSRSVPTKRVDDIGNCYHGRNTPFFDSQLTKASYLKRKKTKFSAVPLVIITFYPFRLWLSPKLINWPMSRRTVATDTFEMGACWLLGCAIQVFIKGHSSLLSKSKDYTESFFNHILQDYLCFSLEAKAEINTTIKHYRFKSQRTYPNTFS